MLGGLTIHCTLNIHHPVANFVKCTCAKHMKIEWKHKLLQWKMGEVFLAHCSLASSGFAVLPTVQLCDIASYIHAIKHNLFGLQNYAALIEVCSSWVFSSLNCFRLAPVCPAQYYRLLSSFGLYACHSQIQRFTSVGTVLRPNIYPYWVNAEIIIIMKSYIKYTIKTHTKDNKNIDKLEF